MWRDPRLILGEVIHRRFEPVSHGFRYPVFACLLPVGELVSVKRVSVKRVSVKRASVTRPIFSVAGFNLLSWHPSDHGRRDGSDPLLWLRSQLVRFGQTKANGEVWLQTFPRVFGFVFNPVSFWYCFDSEGGLRAVLAEVSNTFGERHCYLIAHRDQRPIQAGDEFRCDKVFHVSPFFPVDGAYRFRFVLGQDDLQVSIVYGTDTQTRLVATISGSLLPWTNGQLLSAVARHGWMTVGVVARIHWQAALLYFRRRVRYFRKPSPPAIDVTR